MIALPGAAWAADSTLVLVIGGEAYDGPPKFSVSFDGKPLGEGTVAAAIDTASAGTFAKADDKSAYVQSFTFAVPEATFKPDGSVVVQLTNEAKGDDGSGHDRNLYLASVAVNGRTVTASGLTTETSAGPQPNQMLGEFVELPDGNHKGIGSAPKGGWPEPSVTVAEASSSAEASSTPPEAATSTEAAAATTASSAVAADTATAREAVAAVVAPSAPAETPPTPAVPSRVADAPSSEPPMAASTATTPEPPAETEKASLDSNDAPALKCDLDEIYNVIGFNENSNDLTPALVDRLDQIITDIGDRQCNVQVTGYSSKQGSFATNALFAVERAQNALRYLEQHGVKYLRASATGVGATDQFGPDFRANRRVVISVGP